MSDSEATDIVRKTAGSIRSMETRGAGKIARAASRAIMEYAGSWSGSGREAFLKDLNRAALMLLSTRPTAVSLRNGLLITLRGSEKGETADEIRSIVSEQAQDFIEGSERAVEMIGELGSGIIPKGSTVLTHCNSSAALSAIHEGFRKGLVETVICTESRPWRQGHITSRWLAERGVPVNMIVDSAVRHMMKEVDMVLVGADTITSSGEVVNKIGTSQVALAAGIHSVPFIVCAETYKFSTDTLAGKPVVIEDRGPHEVADPAEVEDFPGVSFRNPVFDITPPEEIRALVTEKGIISPHAAGKVILEMGKGTGPLEQGPEGEFHWLE